MLVDGVCTSGHSLLCVISDGRLRGAMVRGGLRVTCPQCGGDIIVQLESGVLPVARSSEPSVRSGTGRE